MSLKTKTQRFSQKSEKVDEPVDMLPKSRKALSIQEIAALARSSFNGISQVVKDHVTKPTAMAQGRVAHLIEWKGWSKPFDPSSATLQSHFNSYSHLSEGEQEARFAAGVAEQFAIAEAKLRAWNSVDEEDVDEDCSEDDLPQTNDLTITTQSSDAVLSNQLPCQAEADLEALVDDRTVLRDSSLCQVSCEDESLVDVLPKGVDKLGVGEVCKADRRLLWSRGDSCYHSTSYSESGLSPEEEEEEEGREDEEGEDNVFQEVIRWYSRCRSISDTSGAASFDDDDRSL
ncbi:protein FAM131A isoform X1 [Astyanax mexicanus]|uniref:protein FAM131A isoform X1 n=1 Tax=Astyanax mexicanus TaxID=7994 RepID=UPI0020CAB029|nr:protein FAM131A isoform X1 [Astyanax mexicanus]